ncbi:phosphonate C-P lyase system protein PhnG [soil metagenome]
MTRPQISPEQNLRREVMAVLVHAPVERITACLEAVDVPAHQAIRRPENGLIMVRGRIGGDGAPFNLGEASVSRAAVRLNSGETGFGYALGRDGEKATLIALCDALIQNDDFRHDIERSVVAPLRQEQTAARAQQAAQTAATRVDFYTLVRGEN